eukprot:scaffold6986_cov66-Phaeocystis_antarctica.AAC.9
MAGPPPLSAGWARRREARRRTVWRWSVARRAWRRAFDRVVRPSRTVLPDTGPATAAPRAP